MSRIKPDFAAIFDATPTPFIVVAPPEFTIVAVNDAYLRATMSDRAALIGRTLFEAFPDDPADPRATGARNLRASLGRVIAEGRRDVMPPQRYPIRRPAQERFEERWWSVVNAPVPGPDGGVEFIIHRVEDVTDVVRLCSESEAQTQRHQYQQTIIGDLRETESVLRRMISIETVGVLFFDLSGRILEANRAFERMTGYGRDELRGLPQWWVLTAEEFRAETERHALELAGSGHTAPYEKQLVRKDGTRVWGLFAPTRISGAGPAAECVEFIIDISEWKRTEMALHEADRLKDEFLATLGHELRNPLAALRNGLSVIRRAGPDTTLGERSFEVMDRQLNHLVRLVDDLLDVGRITAGKIELRRTVVNLREVLASSVEDSRDLIERRRQTLEIDWPTGELPVEGDVDRLTQVFSNVLSNAAKYTPPGGRIAVSLGREGSEAVVRVTDTGIGISRADLPHVFDLFSQVGAQQDRKAGGLGIGLALVKQLIGLHGGTVAVSSKGIGRGSTFTVRLGLATSPAGNGASDPPDSPVAGRRHRILVADDNPDAVHSLTALLELDGHEVVTACDGMEAVRKATQYPFEFAFLDLGMPRMNGLDAARQIRRLPGREGAILVALTGWGQDRDRERTRAAGFDRHLVKPVSERDLRELLRNAGARAHE